MKFHIPSSVDKNRSVFNAMLPMLKVPINLELTNFSNFSKFFLTYNIPVTTNLHDSNSMAYKLRV